MDNYTYCSNVEVYETVYVKHLAHCLLPSLTSSFSKYHYTHTRGWVCIGEGQEAHPKSNVHLHSGIERDRQEIAVAPDRTPTEMGGSGRPPRG